ncbi:hypothetical protein NP233_g6592 [Leucocoprinus birnbaumii]|uniref:pyranose dehydrogenase (acceptor) n=1 Tax=Leucocoprinus birnbaumii TaxID=56174 RepID=A0AAD5VUA1_9AGAR|nr:hypothetical protein NP233_g6592 [Leucocoprinus birnbaumii]
MTSFRDLLISVLLVAKVALGIVLIENLDGLSDKVNDFDFIVVGGGTAGSVVATRLGENPRFKILVIEAGPSNSEVFATRVPGLWPTLANTRIDWNYTTTPQGGINGNVVGYPRARVLGGCSSHNSMVYTRGSRDDWDGYANVTQNKDLVWENVLPVMLKTERLTKPTPAGHLDPSIHGKSGKLSVSAPYTNISFNDILLTASAELNEEFPFLLDMNDGRPIGTGELVNAGVECQTKLTLRCCFAGWIQSTIDHGERMSAATAYLEKAGDNVHVLLNTQVTRLLTVGHSGLDFRGVELATSANSPRTRLVANKEVILSGGTINTPHLLLNSGIGSRQDLAKVGIRALVDNPSVGRNLSDHTSTSVAFSARTQSTDFDQQAAMQQWNETRTGPLSQSLVTNQITWVRLPSNAEPFSSGTVDPSGGPNSPHIEIIYIALPSDTPATTTSALQTTAGSGNVTIQILLVDLHPISRGSITLNSSNPFDHPLIDFGIFTEPVDIAIAREGIRSTRRLFAAPGLNNTVFGSVSPAANVTSDEDLEAFVRSASAPFGHALGTAAMSPRGASWGVVDPDFTVKGTSGLRIVDASVIPRTPSGHTQAAVYALAEIASAIVTDKYSTH